MMDERYEDWRETYEEVCEAYLEWVEAEREYELLQEEENKSVIILGGE